MKKLFILLALVVFGSPVMAADKYASLDMGKVLQSYKKTEMINNNLQKQENSIRIFYAEAQKNLVSATSEATRKALEDKYTKEYQAKMQKYEQDRNAALQGLEDDVKKAAATEAKKGGYALVLTNITTVYGATDITDSVIKTLNETMK